jgi:alkane 1-monooxygenase
MRILKYLVAYSIPLSVALSFLLGGWWTFLPLVYAFGFIPLLEFILRPDPSNLERSQKEIIAEDPWYDYMLYLLVPIQYLFLIWFLFTVNETNTWLELVGRTSAMGIMCGVIGINVGHELGHRRKKWEQRLAQLLLGSSLYAHFFIEHNYGHHRNVSTPEDPASARYNESLYHFWLRSIWNSYWHAWQIQSKMLKAQKRSFWSLKNEMLIFHLGQTMLILMALIFFSWQGALAFMGAAIFGIILLETVNYIEHYGLSRQKVNDRRYEKASPLHSWNSDHLIGRLVLFELSRHSDHHAHPHKKYQTLDHFDESPQLPTGYPGMMLLATLPPLWFALMNPKIQRTATRQVA